MSTIPAFPTSVIPKVYNLAADQSEKYEQVLTEVSRWESESGSDGKDGIVIEEAERLYLTRECLLRALSGDKYNVTTALKRLKATLRWRREMKLGEGSRESMAGIQEELLSSTFLILSYSPTGLPLIYMRPSLIPKKAFDDPEKVGRMLVWVVERGLDLMVGGVEEVALTCDLSSPISKSRSALYAYQAMMTSLQLHYPERLGWANIVNMGMIGKVVLGLVWPWIDEYTKSKIMTDENPAKSTRMSPSTTMTQYGGTLDFTYDPKTYWTQLIELCETRREEKLERWRKIGGKIGTSEREFMPPVEKVE